MTWQIDTVHTHVGFSVKHMMVSTVRGQFGSYRGTLELDSDDFTKSRFEGEIDVTSINTGNEQRDTHLRSNDFFDAPNHPKITFKSTKIERRGDDSYAVTGDLTIRGVTKPVTLDVEWSGTSKSPYGQTLTGFGVRGTINRKDFGVSFNAALETGGVVVGDKVKLEVDVEAIATAVAA